MTSEASKRARRNVRRGNRWQNHPRVKLLEPAQVKNPRLVPHIRFDWQFLRACGNPVRKGSHLYIIVVCPDCNGWHSVRASELRRRKASGLCRPCSARRNSDNETRGPDHHFWKGGRIVDKNGYVLARRSLFSAEEQEILDGMFNPIDYIREHRATMALVLGRTLTPNEHIHHINGNKQDNRIDNLELIDHHGRTMCPNCGFPIRPYHEE